MNENSQQTNELHKGLYSIDDVAAELNLLWNAKLGQFRKEAEDANDKASQNDGKDVSS